MERGNVKFVWEVTGACSELGWGFAAKLTANLSMHQGGLQPLGLGKIKLTKQIR